MTPPTDKSTPEAMQRQLHLVLGDLLQLELPPLDWSVKYTSKSLDGYTSIRDWDGDLESRSDEEQVQALVAWARVLGAPSIRTVNGGPLWYVRGSYEGIEVEVSARLSEQYAAEHEPPEVVELLPPRADMYVRRSNGQLAEAVK